MSNKPKKANSGPFYGYPMGIWFSLFFIVPLAFVHAIFKSAFVELGHFVVFVQLPHNLVKNLLARKSCDLGKVHERVLVGVKSERLCKIPRRGAEIIPVDNVRGQISAEIEKATYGAYFSLQSALEKQGIEIGIDSAYRSVEYQERIMPRPTSKNDLLNAAKAKVQKVEGTSTDPYITSVVDKENGDNTAIKVGSVFV